MDARKAPSRRPEAAEDVEEAAVATADVDDRGRIIGHEPAVPTHLAAFDPIAEELQQRALDLLLAIRVVVARVDDTHRRGAGARRDEHEPATRAPTQGEQIGDGVGAVPENWNERTRCCNGWRRGGNR